MHRVKLESFFKFQSIPILVIFDGIREFIVSTQYYSLAAKLDHYFKVSTDALAVLSFLKLWYNSVTVPL